MDPADDLHATDQPRNTPLTLDRTAIAIIGRYHGSFDIHSLRLPCLDCVDLLPTTAYTMVTCFHIHEPSCPEDGPFQDMR